MDPLEIPEDECIAGLRLVGRAIGQPEVPQRRTRPRNASSGRRSRRRPSARPRPSHCRARTASHRSASARARRPSCSRVRGHDQEVCAARAPIRADQCQMPTGGALGADPLRCQASFCIPMQPTVGHARDMRRDCMTMQGAGSGTAGAVPNGSPAWAFGQGVHGAERDAGSPAPSRGALLNAEDRLRLGPVLLEAVVVALGRREDVDDHRPEVDQDPVRGRACPRGRSAWSSRRAGCR